MLREEISLRFLRVSMHLISNYLLIFFFFMPQTLALIFYILSIFYTPREFSSEFLDMPFHFRLLQN